MSEPRFRSAADLIDDWREGIVHGTPPVLYPVGTGELARLEVGPGLVTLFGGAPGQGKTALVMQLVLDGLMLTPGLRALICNVEMSPPVLLDRQLARLADLDLTLIRHRRLKAEHADQLDRGLNALEQLSDRLAFVSPPFDLANVAASADAFDSGLIVLDYIQRIGSPGEHGDRRGAVDATMSYLRQFADAGTALIVVAAVSRSKDSKGRSSYSEGLNLASFRESSELEFGADDAFIIVPAEGDGEPSSGVILKHLKSRHGETRDIALTFDRPRQRFTPVESAVPSPKNDGGRLQSALRALWDKAKPAPDDGGMPGEPDQREGDDHPADDQTTVSPSLRGPERLRRWGDGGPEPGGTRRLAHPVPRHETGRDRPNVARRPRPPGRDGPANRVAGGRQAGEEKDAPGDRSRRLEPGAVGLPSLPLPDGVNESTVCAGAYSTVGISLPPL